MVITLSSDEWLIIVELTSQISIAKAYIRPFFTNLGHISCFVAIFWSLNPYVVFVHFSIHLKDTVIRKNNPIKITPMRSIRYVLCTSQKTQQSFTIRFLKLLNNLRSVWLQMKSVSKNTLNRVPWKTQTNFYCPERRSSVSTEISRNSLPILK